MKQTRRKFVVNTLKAGAIVTVASPALMSCMTSETKDSETKLKILILGGTSFLGPHQIAYALERGHTVSTFTRGKTLPTIHKEVFEQVEMLIGDRENDLEALKNRKWDVVIDNSGRQVRWTEETAKLLKENAGIYIYTSSTGVYYPYLVSDINEDSKLVLETPDDAEEDERYTYEYGVMKANSELAVRKHFGEDRSLVFRPTYMLGPGDKTDRFIHWPIRLSRGGDILLPGKADDPVQFMDVRDVAQWMIRMAENKAKGTYNVVGPKSSMNVSQFGTTINNVFDIESNFINIEDYEFLREHKIHYLVPWVPVFGNNYGSARIDNELAIVNGLEFTAVVKTIRDTYNWWYSDALTEERRNQYEGKPGILLNREADILKAWAEKQH